MRKEVLPVPRVSQLQVLSQRIDEPLPPPRVAVVGELHENVRIRHDNWFGAIGQLRKDAHDAFSSRASTGVLAERATHRVNAQYVPPMRPDMQAATITRRRVTMWK